MTDRTEGTEGIEEDTQIVGQVVPVGSRGDQEMILPEVDSEERGVNGDLKVGTVEIDPHLKNRGPTAEGTVGTEKTGNTRIDLDPRYPTLDIHSFHRHPRPTR